MKKIICAMALTLMVVVSFTQSAAAQDEWAQGKTGIYSVGIGGTQLIYLNNGYAGNFTRTDNIGFSMNVSGEYKVWNWIGVGFQTGLDLMWFNYNYPGYLGYGAYSEHVRGPVSIGIPVGAKVNFHILDAVGGLSIAKKLDVYAGLGIGGGPLIPTQSGANVIGFMYVGPQVGVRYWFNSSVAIFGEFGWGATFANAGVTF